MMSQNNEEKASCNAALSIGRRGDKTWLRYQDTLSYAITDHTETVKL